MLIRPNRDFRDPKRELFREREIFRNRKLKYEYIPCPLCLGNGKERYFISDYNYRIVQCQRCKFVYENPRPILDDLFTLYDTAYFDHLTDNAVRNLEITKLNLSDINFDEYENGLLDKGKRILDVGCEKGTFLKYMQERGWSCYGVELGDEAYNMASKNKALKVYHGELVDANFKSDFFHVIHLGNVIEHVSNPLEVLKECHRILKEGGLLIVVTPNYGSISRLLWGSARRDFIAIHVCFFSKKTLKRTLVEIGFDVKKQVSWGGGFASGQVSAWLKKSIDKITKKLNAGDQMLVAAIKK